MGLKHPLISSSFDSCRSCQGCGAERPGTGCIRVGAESRPWTFNGPRYGTGAQHFRAAAVRLPRRGNSRRSEVRPSAVEERRIDFLLRCQNRMIARFCHERIHNQRISRECDHAVAFTITNGFIKKLLEKLSALENGLPLSSWITDFDSCRSCQGRDAALTVQVYSKFYSNGPSQRERRRETPATGGRGATRAQCGAAGAGRSGAGRRHHQAVSVVATNQQDGGGVGGPGAAGGKEVQKGLLPGTRTGKEFFFHRLNQNHCPGSYSNRGPVFPNDVLRLPAVRGQGFRRPLGAAPHDPPRVFHPTSMWRNTPGHLSSWITDWCRSCHLSSWITDWCRSCHLSSWITDWCRSCH